MSYIVSLLELWTFCPGAEVHGSSLRKVKEVAISYPSFSYFQLGAMTNAALYPAHNCDPLQFHSRLLLRRMHSSKVAMHLWFVFGLQTRGRVNYGMTCNFSLRDGNVQMASVCLSMKVVFLIWNTSTHCHFKTLFATTRHVLLFWTFSP
jgi:hypothetical protein